MTETAAFDTLTVANDLQRAGFDRKQAEALTKTIAKAQGTQATKGDIGRLEIGMDALETRMDALETRMDTLETRMGALETRMDALETRMDALETRMQSEFSEIKADSARMQSDLAEMKVSNADLRAGSRFLRLSVLGFMLPLQLATLVPVIAMYFKG